MYYNDSQKRMLTDFEKIRGPFKGVAVPDAVDYEPDFPTKALMLNQAGTVFYDLPDALQLEGNFPAGVIIPLPVTKIWYSGPITDPGLGITVFGEPIMPLPALG